MFYSENPHFNIGNIQIELTTDDPDEGGGDDGGNNARSTYY